MTKLYGYLVYLVWWMRLPMLWSKLYHAIWERKYKRYWKERLSEVELCKYKGPFTATVDVCRLSFRSDGWRELGDAVRHPGWVLYQIEKRLEQGLDQTDGAIDCEDFAFYIANTSEVFCVFNVVWRDGWRVGGHYVAVWLHEGLYYHGGNWGVQGPFNELGDIVKDMCKGRTPLVATMIDRKMRVGSICLLTSGKRKW